MSDSLIHVKETISKKQKEVKIFWVNDKCVGCGVCEEVCPQNIIQLRKEHPVWTEDNCVSCLACLHRCPEHTIQYGREKADDTQLQIYSGKKEERQLIRGVLPFLFYILIHRQIPVLPGTVFQPLRHHHEEGGEWTCLHY